MTAEVFAPAKINLTLHVTGQRADGYHLLDSLVVFADVGDTVRVTPGEGFTVTGPRAAGVPVDGGNLVMRAAALMGASGLAITLDKHLPAASGIGGGSSDAAATLLAVARATGRALPEPKDILSLGADVPVCLTARPVRMEGIGETLTAVPHLPPFHLVLVNPGVEVPTPAVFAALGRKDNAPMPRALPAWPDAAALAAWLAAQRNDLEPPAKHIAPEVGTALARIAATEGCLLSRMSGSGATCFGLYAARAEAEAAAATLQRGCPDWWTTAASPIARAPASSL
ncbi:4-(cytidine 5'-diphospho)-2-C-methyl-D-erythritol kinase [Anianabacter salinae]|uniref:4-(cytidine 5'-diphospho)-2-C-methyl-D-erythritol kinase n=1 Tax=Anianabacter salinae TaxID=2851023 RepID=UPI00225E32D7|nr:4-(cytidine 5'-diphospho)-2-C-methyl-D-erythritol kinase [Anianabacter salinae]MBV0913247.1 4-(cytidine 5'-diphospho)-2-C-methyl-D-erythritol kinase [Anianabacter salinae]